ncbi:prepilin-type N-terminal cleavage/methylation domain-containing protein [Clostridium sp.]|uniref:prepilin-type N-terminal cleavage/methylation domain-containing protein n=1 Tax=Clostridium sp. TaxID=1506 RepID=UPI003D6CE430
MEGIKYKKGFTLIEVVISIAILSIIIAPILSLTLSTLKINKQSDDKLKAINIAQKNLEEIKSFDYKLLPGATFPIKETKTENSFSIERTIIPIEEYKFDVSNNDINIIYDAEVKDSVIKNNIPGVLTTNYITNNNLEIDFSGITSREINVKIELTGNDSVNIDLNNINNSDSNNIINNTEGMNVYFTKGSRYSITRCSGKVNIFTNISENTDLNDNYRLYKVIIEVKKGSKSLQKIEGYKTCLK